MKIKTKIFMIIFLLLILSFSQVYAVDMFLNNTSYDSNSEELLIEENNIVNEVIENEELYESSTTSNPAPTVTHTSSSSFNTTLSISDIIDIILIAVCIVLIFLAIAILIRCK